jgi:hypothetical protein
MLRFLPTLQACSNISRIFAVVGMTRFVGYKREESKVKLNNNKKRDSSLRSE